MIGLDNKLRGRCVNRIKKRDRLEGHCALSLVLDEAPSVFRHGRLPDEFFDGAGALVVSFEARRDWGDVLRFLLAWHLEVE